MSVLLYLFRHFSLARNVIQGPNTKILDYGSGTGGFLGELNTNNSYKTGYDVDLHKIKVSQHRYPNIKFVKGRIGAPLPFKDSSFNIVTMFHVLEHVDSETEAVAEVARVLKKKGLFLLASPYDGLFSWADVANLRYRFPFFHRLAIEMFLGRSVYEKRFIDRKRIDMFGDCTVNRDCHKHYTQNDLENLLKEQFTLQRIYKFSFFYPFLLIPYNIINYLFKPKFNSVLWFIHFDNLINAGDLSYNFFLIAKKR